MTDVVTEIPINIEDGSDLGKKKESANEDSADTSGEKETAPKQRSVSFNKDVHVKRYGKPRSESRPSPSEHPLRKEPFTHLSEKELLDEAAKVIAQADSVTCTSDHPPEKFFSLPHRKKPKDIDKRRKSDDQGEIEEAKPLGRSTSDVGTPKKKGKERTSLSTLFRRAKTTSPDRNVSKQADVIITPKPGVIIKRSKSDVSDLKSNPNFSSISKPIRKRSGSESEEFFKLLRNKKAQLSPIIEATAREDYFCTQPTKTEDGVDARVHIDRDNNQKQISETTKVNPIEKPPRFRSPDKKTEPKPPIRIKRSRALTNLSDTKPQEPPISETPKRKTDLKKTILVDEIDQVRDKDLNPVDLKDKIKESIHKLETKLYVEKEMVHSSQQPTEKLPLTKGKTVNHIVKLLKEDQFSLPPKAHLIQASTRSNSQPFSYTRPSVSPDPNLYIRPSSPERVPSPVNKMYPEKGVVYAQVVRNHNENGNGEIRKETVHKTYSPSRENGSHSDEDEGLGCEERNKYFPNRCSFDKNKSSKPYRALDSPITPRFREFKKTTIETFDDLEPTYANEFALKPSRDYVDSAFRGRADGMDSKRKNSVDADTKVERYDLNDLSQRRQLLESRINSRMFGEKTSAKNTISKYLEDPIYEAENRMKATEKYVNETARYYHHTVERGAFVENSISSPNRIMNFENHIKHDYEDQSFDKYKDVDRHERVLKSQDRAFPPEPEYEPPSLDSNISIDKKYKSKYKLTTSHDFLHSGQKYSKPKDDFGKRKGHYASNPEIVQEREEIYENAKYDPKYADTYHNSLRRDKQYDRQYKSHREGHKYSSRLDDRDRENRFVDSGIENDFRKDSSGEISKANKKNYNIKISPNRDSDDDGMKSFLTHERRHTEQIYANGDCRDHKKKYVPRERSIDDGSHYDPRIDRFEHSPVRNEEKVIAKPPKAIKKFSGLEKVVKQLFSSTKKSKKEKEVQKPRTRVLKSPEHLTCEHEQRHSPERFISREDLHRRYKEYRGSSEDRESERPSDPEYDRRERPSRTRNYRVEDSSRLAERYSNRRRLATPSPTPSPPRRSTLLHPPPPPETSAGNWFKSLDRLARKKSKAKESKESAVHTDNESTSRKTWTSKKPLTSPEKNLRFFGDTDLESDTNAKHSVTKSAAHHKSTLRKTVSNSNSELDEVDRKDLSKKSYSLSNLREESPKRELKYRRDLHNISENHSVSGDESHAGRNRRSDSSKPPIPYDRRSRSQSSSKVVKGDGWRSGYGNSRTELRDGSPSELRTGNDRSSRGDSRMRRRTPAHSGESSTEGESSHQSQRSVVYLHATTVGDIPDPSRTRNRSRDDVSSLSSQQHAKTVARSFSFLAPWRPRHHAEPYDVHYTTTRPNKRTHKQTNAKAKPQTQNGSLEKNRSMSQTTLSRKKLTPSRLSSSNNTLYKKKSGHESSKENVNTLNRRDLKSSSSTEVLSASKGGERVSRSISMPKEDRAGWFKMAKNKKNEQTSRVR